MARVLLIHHDLTQIMLFKNVLTRHAYEVVSALDYASAIEIVQKRSIQLAFFSVWLSGINGIDLAHALRTLDPTLPLVVLLAQFHPQNNRLDALNVKGIIRPFEPDKIIMTTQMYIRSSVEPRV